MVSIIFAVAGPPCKWKLRSHKTRLASGAETARKGPVNSLPPGQKNGRLSLNSGAWTSPLRGLSILPQAGKQILLEKTGGAEPVRMRDADKASIVLKNCRMCCVD